MFNKYKCIRCLKDDRINDGMLVTIDQCLSCTRYEPIAGQVYDILDDSGMNGATILDEMQLAYMDLEDMWNLNAIEKRATEYKYANVNKDSADDNHKGNDFIETWKKEDLEKYKSILEDLKKAREEWEEKHKEDIEEYEGINGEDLSGDQDDQGSGDGTHSDNGGEGSSDVEVVPDADSDDNSDKDLGSNENKPNTNPDDGMQILSLKRTSRAVSKEDLPDEPVKDGMGGVITNPPKVDDGVNSDGDDGDEEAKPIPKPHPYFPNDPFIWDKDLDDIREEDYMFIMDWTPFDFELQEPDIKPYPFENIRSKYKIPEYDKEDEDNDDEDDKENQTDTDEESEEELHGAGGDYDPDAEYDSDLGVDKEKLDQLKAGQWTDTREIADTRQYNRYSSEDFYFEGFNVNRTGGNGMTGAICRQKIVEMAYKIVDMHNNKEAGYNNNPRTVDFEKPQYFKPSWADKEVMAFDCSSFVSTCYKYAGLTDVYSTTADNIKNICQKNGYCEQLTESNLSSAQPGDIVWCSGHVMVYTGGDSGEICHATESKAPPNGIKKNHLSDRSGFRSGSGYYLCRPADLVAADASASAGATGGQACSSVVTKDGKTLKCKWMFPKACITTYTDEGRTADGSVAAGNVAAAHNIPYGTKIYIPDCEGKGGGGKVGNMDLGAKNNGIYKVADTGGPYFDFDVHTDQKLGKDGRDVYILDWGDPASSKKTWNFCDALRFRKRKGDFSTKAWNLSMSIGLKTLGFSMFYPQAVEDNSINKSNPLSSV